MKNYSNPYQAPEVDTPKQTPSDGMRGLYPTKEGWMDIDGKGNKKKIATESDISDLQAQIDKKINHSDISNVYKFKGSVENIEDVLIKYQCIIAGNPTLNGKVVGYYDSDKIYITEDIEVSNYNLRIPIKPIILKPGTYNVGSIFIDVNGANIIDNNILNITEQTVITEVGFGSGYTLEAGQEVALFWLDYIYVGENSYNGGTEIGDIYNETRSGMNYAWTGTEWDALGGSVSDESVKEDIDKIKTELDKKANKEDVVSAYRFCGSVETFDEELMTPATYEIIPKGNPTYNGVVVGTYDAESRTVTIDSSKLEGWEAYEVVVPIEEIAVPKGYYSCEWDISIAGMDGYWVYDHYVYKKNNEEIVTTVSIGNYGYHGAGTIELGNLKKYSSVEVELAETPFYNADYQVIATLETGDVYNVLDTGMNYAWNGIGWDALGGEHKDLEAREEITKISADLDKKADKTTTDYLTIQLNSKANKSDITNVYKFMGSVNTFDDLPIAYPLIPNGVPTHNGVACGTFDEETHTVTINDVLLVEDTDRIIVPIVPISIKEGKYFTEYVYYGNAYIGNLCTYVCGAGGSTYEDMPEQTIDHIEIFTPYGEETISGTTNSLGTLDKIVDSWLIYEWSNYPEIPNGAYDNGAVYNVIEDGMNYAWTGTEWDALGGFSEFHKAERFSPVVILDGIESETTYKKIWGVGGLIDNNNGYTAINTLIDVIPNVQYRIVNFNGVLTFYDSEQFNLASNTATFEHSTHIPTEYIFTIPNKMYKLGLSMLQPQSLNDIKLYRISPIDEETSETVYTKDDLIVGKDNFNDNEIKAFLPLHKKQIVNFGDSIFGMYKAPSDISSRLADLTGATVYNCGFSGSTVVTHSSEAHKPFSMHELATAIASGDFSKQDTAIETYASTLGVAYANNLATLKSIDFNKVDIVTLAYGTNDFNGGAPVDHATYPKHRQIFAGALRYTIETLLGAYPNLKIFLCTPIFRVWYNSTTLEVTSTSDDKIVNNGWGLDPCKLTDFVEKVKEIGNDYHIPVIDNYYELGINSLNHKRYLDCTDGTHPTGEGLELIARHIAHGLLIGGNSGYISRIIKVETAMGDIETALDSIIEIQNSLIGGGSV